MKRCKRHIMFYVEDGHWYAFVVESSETFLNDAWDFDEFVERIAEDAMQKIDKNRATLMTYAATRALVAEAAHGNPSILPMCDANMNVCAFVCDLRDTLSQGAAHWLLANSERLPMTRMDAGYFRSMIEHA